MLNRLIQRIYEIPGESERFTSMEGLRAYAAFLIFLVHYFGEYAQKVLKLDLNEIRLAESPTAFTALIYYLHNSQYGVDIFFFLSGFLIYRIITRNNFSYFDFVRDRALRIYPAFGVSLLIYAYTDILASNGSLNLLQFVGNLLFLNGVPSLNVEPYNYVTWTLFYEFAFYLTFPAILLFPRDNGRVRPWRVLESGIVFLSIVFFKLFRDIGFEFVRFAMFFGGALMACYTQEQLKRLVARIPDIAVLILYLASTLFFSYVNSWLYFVPIFLFTTFLLASKALYDKGLLHWIFSLTFMRYMGNISYSFYLMHRLAIWLVMESSVLHLFEGSEGWLLFAATFGSTLLLSVIFATALFVMCERPYFIWKRIRQARTVA
jgi:exopolysaccharide production protein ExoZ